MSRQGLWASRCVDQLAFRPHLCYSFPPQPYTPHPAAKNLPGMKLNLDLCLPFRKMSLFIVS